MKQIRLDEMTESQKLKYVEPKRRSGVRLGNFLAYGIPALGLTLLVVWECISTDGVKIIYLVLYAIPLSASAFIGARIHENAMSFYEELMDERVWGGYIDDFQMNQEIEFIDKNGQSVVKKFTDKSFKKYAGKKKVYVMYIPIFDVWYMERKML